MNEDETECGDNAGEDEYDNEGEGEDRYKDDAWYNDVDKVDENEGGNDDDG